MPVTRDRAHSSWGDLDYWPPLPWLHSLPPGMCNAMETSDWRRAGSMQVQSLGLAPSMLTVVGASHRSLSWHLVLRQSHRPKLGPSVVEGAWGANGEGLSSLAPVKWMPVGPKLVTSAGEFVVAMLDFSFFSGKVGLSTEQVTVNRNCSCCVPAPGSSCFPISGGLSFSSRGGGVGVGGLGIKPKWDLCAIPQKCFPHSPFPDKVNSFWLRSCP